MTTGLARGPSGAAPLAPPWLAVTNLPIEIVPATTTFHRVHRNACGPVFFGPGAGNPPTYRFDPTSGRFGILYIAFDVEGAIVETVVRNPERNYVDNVDLITRARSELRSNRDLRLVKIYGDGLSPLGTNNAISTGPYGPCAAWSDALWDHKDQPDGILYQSRHASTRICMAIFERPDLKFSVSATVALVDEYPRLITMLGLLGKTVR
jgi:hypothetical protein